MSRIGHWIIPSLFHEVLGDLLKRQVTEGCAVSISSFKNTLVKSIKDKYHSAPQCMKSDRSESATSQICECCAIRTGVGSGVIVATVVTGSLEMNEWWLGEKKRKSPAHKPRFYLCPSTTVQLNSTSSHFSSEASILVVSDICTRSSSNRILHRIFPKF